MLLRPSQLTAAMASLPIDAAAPAPMVVHGSYAEWRTAESDIVARAPALRGCVLPTIALVEGSPSAKQPPGLVAFDLVAHGDASRVAEQAERWRAGFARAPHAGALLAALSRAEPPTLLAESLAYSTLQAGAAHRRWLAKRPPRREPDVGDRVEASIVDGICEIVLRRPLRRNALDTRMRDELCAVLDAVAVGAPTPIVLRGVGPSFCAGGDLDEFGTRADPLQGHVVRSAQSVARRLALLGDRLVVAVHGACVGAGVELAAFGARVLAADDATFALPETRFGLIPGAGGTVSIPARIGRRRFLDWALAGTTVDACTAHRWGMVDDVVAGADLVSRARALARDAL